MNKNKLAAITALALAGVIHLAAATVHMTHMTAHGLSLLAIGVLQLLWALAAWRWWNRGVMAVGIALSLGIVLLWALLYSVPSPFVGHLTIHARTFDWMLVATKLCELVGGLLLLWRLFASTRAAPGMPRWLRAGAPAAFAITATGVILWCVAASVETVFPVFSVSVGWPTWELVMNLRPAPTNVTEEPRDADAPDYDWRLPPHFPRPRVPEDNPMRAETVELGRHLFYDKRLSGNGTQSCESCHVQALAFSDGRALPVGSTGETLARNSPALVNVAYDATLTWANPVLTELERQVLVPMFGEFPVELGITAHEEAVLQRFQTDVQYQRMFAAAFPDDPAPINFHNITRALAAFVRALVSADSAYDRYTVGDKTALSPAAQRGMEMFFSEELECHHCHTGFNFSASTVHANSTFSAAVFQNNGLYNLDGQGAYPRGNRGVYEITGKSEDMGRFRPPTLRNIALTAPYMHDGSIATLEDVVRHYMAGGRVIEEGELAGDGRRNPYKNGLVSGFQLTDSEIADLIAFLESLTDESFITDPRFANPFGEVTHNQVANR